MKIEIYSRYKQILFYLFDHCHSEINPQKKSDLPSVTFNNMKIATQFSYQVRDKITKKPSFFFFIITFFFFFPFPFPFQFVLPVFQELSCFENRLSRRISRNCLFAWMTEYPKIAVDSSSVSTALVGATSYD
jgi:hypothetical protein